MTQPAFDFVVFGATSFVGEILCQYMMDEYGVDGDVRWAAAARSQGKLDTLKQSLGDDANNLSLIVADASDENALTDMVAQAKVIISTVGPYALYGEPLVKICAETGTDYCDLSGEAQWVRVMIQKYEAVAKKSGARIIHCCGFDSIPSDLGVHFFQQEAKAQQGTTCNHIKMGVKAIKGGMSGGTVASLLNVVKEATANPTLRKELSNPYSICPEGHAFKARQRNVNFATFDADFQRWLAPFIMAAVNVRVVHRSNALSGNVYGEDFKYDEAMLMKGRLPATIASLGIGGFMFAAAVAPLRWVLEKFIVPKPGEGPSPDAQKKGFYDLRFMGTLANGGTLRTKVTGDRDPGYGSTAKMLAQTAICLAQDKEHTNQEGGFWTPATALGDTLIKRLEKHAGLSFEV
ncbi:MAG: trans-acting enoyl reductase family protein, partial [Kordiimonas sp.]